MSVKAGVLLGVGIGIALGVGLYTFVYARGYSYMTDNAESRCQTCHKWSEDELKARVDTIQPRTYNLRNLAMDALVELINDIRQRETQVGMTLVRKESPLETR